MYDKYMYTNIGITRLACIIKSESIFPKGGGGGGVRDNFVCRGGEGLRALFSVIREFNIQ